MLKEGDKIKITNRWSVFFGEILTVQSDDGNGRYICKNPSHPQGECVVYSRDNGKDWVYAKEELYDGNA